MEKLKKIKEKMQKFLEEIKNVDTPDEAIEKFKQIFDGEYYETFTDIDEPYYESHSQKLYLQNGYGIGIEKLWGPFDFTGGGVVSHKGEDLHIFSELADEYIIGDKIDVAGALEINSYGGMDNLQINIKDIMRGVK